MNRIHLYIKNIIIIALILLVFQLVMPDATVFANRDGQFPTIGGVEISVKKESEIQAILADSIAKWRTEPIIVKGQAGKIEIPAEMIRFNVKETVRTYLEAINTPWYKPWMKTPIVHFPLLVESTEEMDKEIRGNLFFKTEETTEAILAHASLLKETEVIPEELTIHKDMMNRTAFEIQEIHGNQANLSAFVDQLDGLLLAPGEVFSFLEKMDDLAGINDFETRQFFASVLYSLALQSETKIMERHSQNKIPSYLQPGVEVDVNARLNLDFVFQNNSESPMLFAANIDNRHLLIELYTVNSNDNVSYSVVEKEIKPRTIYRLSSNVQRGQEKVIQDGSNGYRVTVYRAFYDEVLGYEVDEEISRDFYPPVHKVIAVASIEETEQDETTENIGSSENVPNEPEKSTNPSNHQDGSKEELPENNSSEEEVIYDKGGNVIYDPNE